LELIASLIFRDLIEPEIRPCLGHFEIAAIMPMPKAAMDEDGRPMLWKHQVGLPWQVNDMNAKSETLSMQGFTDEDLRGGIFAPDPGHHPGSRGSINDISQ
jgi:hypothetical protein